MKSWFYVGVVALAVFEAAAVWFVMPMPGSQRVRSVGVAYFLYTWRWAFRLLFGAMIVAGLRAAWRARRRWPAPAALALVAGLAYAVNYRMAADRLFREPAALVLRPAAGNAVDTARLVVGVELAGDARAYPLQFIGYHHQVRDRVGGRPVLVTYCTVCRSGRVYSPVVGGREETFRLVGMDQFNAMFEDRGTRSWWRQASGEAVAGPLAGAALGEVPSRQTTLGRWLALHPNSLVMQADPASRARYPADSSYAYERGTSRGALTGTDTVSWHDKAWVVGLTAGGRSRAYDWNRLRRERVVNDTLGGRPVVLALAADGGSFFAFARPDAATRFALRRDSLVAARGTYALSGRGAPGAAPASLTPLTAYQEFWHSWRTFRPGTSRW